MSTSVERHAYRIAGGVALPFVAGEALGGDVPFLASIFALMLLAPPRPPAPRAALAGVLGIGVAFLAALLLTAVTLPHPVVFALAAGLAIYGALYGQARKGGAFWFFLLVAICATPLLARQSEGLASLFARLAVEAMLVAVLVSWLMYAVFPGAAGEAPPPPATLAPRAAARAAFVGMMVLMPLLLLLLSHTSAAVVIMITALSLLKASSVQESTRTATGLVAANVIAGVAAVLAYAAIMAAPTLVMLAAVMLALTLAFGGRIALGGQPAALATAACTAAVLLVGMGLTPFTDSATAFTTRLTQVLAASAYTVGAFMLLERLLPPAQG
jgi:hypothetical protein